MKRFPFLFAVLALPAPSYAAEIAPMPIAASVAPLSISAAAVTTPIVVEGRVRVDSRMPLQMTPADRAAYRQIFAAIHDGRFVDASIALDRMPSSGLLTATAHAELWLAAGSPKPDNQSLAGWLATSSSLPQAPRIVALARQAGLTELPVLPTTRGLRPVIISAREKPRATKADAISAATIAQIRQLLSLDKLQEAEDLLANAAFDNETRTEWAQRIAWSYYLAGNDAKVRPLAVREAAGNGQWAAMGHWVAGLSAFRMGDFSAASEYFARVAAGAHSDDLAAAGYFWAARADTASGRPERVSTRLRMAARYDDCFYGVLAKRLLGIERPPPAPKPDFLLADWKHVADLPSARRAAALVEIGELGLADRELRYLAMTGSAEDHVPLTYLAAKLNLPATQYWLSHNAPPGVKPPVSTRYPAPEWVPARGWRVDRSLVYAHALQESRFITDAKSRAGARGVMQLMPGTAKQIASGMALPAAEDRLVDPSFNIEFGQTYLEMLRDSQWTGGLLPKVIAAYNAGPGSIKKWNEQLRDNNDPLLFIESIPFEETRHYVEIVLKNYWMYEQGDGVPSASLDAMAQGMWPRFPGLPGPSARRIESIRSTASAN